MLSKLTLALVLLRFASIGTLAQLQQQQQPSPISNSNFNPSAWANMTNILQQLLDQATQMQQSSHPGGNNQNTSGSTDGDNTPQTLNNVLTQFFSQFVQIIMRIFNQIARIFTIGLINPPPQTSSILLRNSSSAEEVAQIDDHTLQRLHSRVHGSECDCDKFRRENLPQFSKISNDSVVKPKTRESRSVQPEFENDSTKQLIEHLNDQVVQKLIDQLMRADEATRRAL